MQIEGLQYLSNQKSETILSILDRVNIGEILKAYVVEIRTNEILLKLLDGTIFTASMATEIDAKSGELLEFLVADKTDKQIILERAKDDSSREINSTEHVKEELISIGLKPNNKNIQIAQELKLKQIPLNSDIFKNIADAVSAYRNIDIRKAIFLALNNQEINEKNIELLTSIIEKNFNIGEKLSQITNQLSDMASEDFIESFTANIKKELSMLEAKASGKGYIPGDNEKSNFPGKIDNSFRTNDFATNNTNTNIGNFDKGDNVNNSSKDTSRLYKFAEAEHVDELIQRTVLKIKSAISRNESKLGISNSISNEKNSIRSIFNEMFQRVDQAKTQPDLEIKTLYREMYFTLELIKNSVKSFNMRATGELANNIEGVQSTLLFLNELNNYHSYIQIPLKTWNNNTTGELYVLKRGSKKRKINPENATVLLSLQMKHMGRVDSLIKLSNKNLSIDIRGENQKTINHIKDNYLQLYNMLSESGYKLFEIKYRIIDSDINVLNFEDAANEVIKTNQRTIDLKI